MAPLIFRRDRAYWGISLVGDHHIGEFRRSRVGSLRVLRESAASSLCAPPPGCVHHSDRGSRVAVAVMNETAANTLPIAQRLFERVEHEGRLRRTRDSPADNPPGVDVG